MPSLLLFWILELISCLPKSRALFSFPLAETDGFLSSPSSSHVFSSSSLLSPCLELSFLITRYAIRTHMPLWPLLGLFPINTFPIPAEANVDHLSEFRLNSQINNFCRSRYRFPEGKISSLVIFPYAFRSVIPSRSNKKVHINDKWSWFGHLSLLCRSITCRNEAGHTGPSGVFQQLGKCQKNTLISLIYLPLLIYSWVGEAQSLIGCVG